MWHCTVCVFGLLQVLQDSWLMIEGVVVAALVDGGS